MADPAAAHRLFLQPTSNNRIRILPVFLFRELAVYRHLHGADARAQALPLVTTGDPDFVEHDFHSFPA